MTRKYAWDSISCPTPLCKQNETSQSKFPVPISPHFVLLDGQQKQGRLWELTNISYFVFKLDIICQTGYGILFSQQGSMTAAYQTQIPVFTVFILLFSSSFLFFSFLSLQKTFCSSWAGRFLIVPFVIKTQKPPDVALRCSIRGCCHAYVVL